MVRVLILLFFMSPFAVATPDIDDMGDGIFVQQFRFNAFVGAFGYIVDSRTEICLIKWFRKDPAGMEIVSCVNLAKRKEWKDIITWIDDTRHNVESK
jgi:hypothetical protein